jgi:hypothetical protein
MPLIELSTLSPSSFPSEEDGTFEFKSSLTSAKAAKDKLNKAVSGFANSGGGCFIWGVDGNGNADGGVDKQIGGQPIRDWLDQIVNLVSPAPAYECKPYDDSQGRGALGSDKIIVAVSVHPSERAPHMANDGKYYIRAGAHTEPAGNYIVEALWARRHHAKPVLSHVIRRKQGNSRVLQLGVVALTDTPALNVRVKIAPARGLLTDLAKHFPLQVPVIDRSNPLFFDATLSSYVNTELAEDVKLVVEYSDLAGNEYQYISNTPLGEGLGPITIGNDVEQEIAKNLAKIEAKLDKVVEACKRR